MVGVRHVAVYRWAGHVDDEHVRRISAAHDRLAARLVGLVRFDHGAGLAISADGFDYHVVAEFRTVDDWRAYRDHPDRLVLVAELLDGAVVEHADGQFAVTSTVSAHVADTGSRSGAPASDASDDEILAAARRLAAERMAALLAEPDTTD
jgi:hypothetical protein